MFKQTLASLACLHGVLVWAAPADPLSEMDYFAEQPVVLSASRLSQPINRAPAAVTVITREMIEVSGFRHLVDVLRLVPGFVVGWSGGNMPAATYLGLASGFPNWMQVMVDGRSIYNPASGATTWRGIPLTLDDVERIEIVRGPNAANDGLNSMLGTVHIFTRHSAATVGGMGLLAGGDKQYREANLRYGAEAGGGSWRLGVLGREDERHGVDKDHASDVQLSFRGDFQPTLRDDLMLQMGVSNGSWQGTNVGLISYDEQHADYLSGFVNMKWTRALGPGRERSLQIHHGFSQSEEAFQLPSPLDPQDGDYRATSSGIQFSYLDHNDADLRTSLTGEYRLNRVRLPVLLEDDGYVHDGISRVAGAVEWSFAPAWVFHAAAMVEHHSDTHQANFSPRIAFNWLPSSEHAFRISASHGATALGLFANNSDAKITVGGEVLDQRFISTGEIESEKIDSYELGYLLSKPRRRLNLDVRIFHNRIRDVLDRVNVPFPDADGRAKTFVNLIGITQSGLEYQLRWRARQNGWLVLSQSWVDTDSDQDVNYPPSTPRHTLALLASHPMGGVDASVGYYRTSRMRWKGSDGEDPASRYNRLDLRLARAWKASDGKIEAALVLQSLLGGEAESFDNYPSQTFDRRGYLSLKYEFR